LLTNLWRRRNVIYILRDDSILANLRQNQRAPATIGTAALRALLSRGQMGCGYEK
jgi:hypothetical protein